MRKINSKTISFLCECAPWHGTILSRCWMEGGRWGFVGVCCWLAVQPVVIACHSHSYLTAGNTIRTLILHFCCCCRRWLGCYCCCCCYVASFVSRIAAKSKLKPLRTYTRIRIQNKCFKWSEQNVYRKKKQMKIDKKNRTSESLVISHLSIWCVRAC